MMREALTIFSEGTERITHPGKPRHRSTNGGDDAAPSARRELVDGDV